MNTQLRFFLAACLTVSSPAAAQWNPNPAQNLAVRDQTGTGEVTPRTAPAPNGGTWVAWFETVPATNYQLRLQLLNVNGQAQLGTAGLLVSNQPQGSALYRYDLKADNLGNAVLAFQDVRSAGTNQCVVYKISPTGQQLWGLNGIPLLDATASSGLSPVIGITTGNNVVIGWTAGGTANATHSTKWVPMLKYSAAGVALWAAPVRLQDPLKRYSRAAFVAVPGSEDVVAQYVEETGSGLGVSTVYAQRFDATGTALWPAAVRVSDKTIGFASFPEQLPDGNGGFYTMLGSGNPANASLGDVYAQRILADGGQPWGITGTEVLTGTATARFGGSLQWLAARNEVWTVVNELNSSQSNSGFTVQRFDPATGTRQLGSSGTPVQAVSPNYYSAQSLRNTGTGLIITYTENTSATNRALWATKVNYLAQPAFPVATPNILLSSVASPKLNFSTLPFANGQLVNVWADQRTDDGIYAQTISNNGALGVLATRVGQLAVQSLEISPNPGAAPLLHLTLPHAQVLEVQVRDLTGRVVWQQRTPAGPGPATFALDAAGLAAGLYLIETSVDDTTCRSRWVKP